jgi:hypothetical protein
MRKLTIPASWTGRAIILDLQRVSTDAAVFLDGREVGKVSWPGGEVDLTGCAIRTTVKHRSPPPEPNPHSRLQAIH